MAHFSYAYRSTLPINSAFSYNVAEVILQGASKMMLTCPNCGAENKEGSPFCRMCAASLESSGMKGGAANPFYQNPAAQAEAPTQISCPACKTLNDADWAFCQECGYKMSQ